MTLFRITVAALVALLPALAHAEPKTIVLDGCVKIETELRAENGRTTTTVKCTGEANDPKVREPMPTFGSVSILPGSGGARVCTSNPPQAC